MDLSHSAREESYGRVTRDTVGAEVVGWPKSRLRLNVVADFLEEGWPSMDLTAEMLVEAGARMSGVECRLIRPALWRCSRVDRFPSARDRALGRFLQYPLRLARQRRRGQCFHVADHSYAHLTHLLPRRRVGVYCHDLDAFRAVAPGGTGSFARQVMARCLLDGLRRAALVFYSTEVVREQILEAGLVPSERLVHAPYGTAPEFSPEPDDWDSRVRQRLPGRFLLHVGSCIPRKNTALLLRLLARLRQDLPDLCLLQVGGAWPEAQRALLGELGLTHAVLQLRDVPRAELAAMYRQAEVVLLPSHAEGFGLPLIEALACGAKVLATRLPVFLEVGGTAAHYAASDDLEEWTTASKNLLSLRAHLGKEQCARAARYSWEKHAELVVGAYRRLACESAAVRA